MLIAMRKEGRTSLQYASERDAAWLEKNGWIRFNETPTELVKPAKKMERKKTDSPVSVGLRAVR